MNYWNKLYEGNLMCLVLHEIQGQWEWDSLLAKQDQNTDVPKSSIRQRKRRVLTFFAHPPTFFQQRPQF